jgi:hypothetical protein
MTESSRKRIAARGRGFGVGRVVFGPSWTYKTTAAACGNTLSWTGRRRDSLAVPTPEVL